MVAVMFFQSIFEFRTTGKEVRALFYGFDKTLTNASKFYKYILAMGYNVGALLIFSHGQPTMNYRSPTALIKFSRLKQRSLHSIQSCSKIIK